MSALPTNADQFEAATYKKVIWRLMPYLFVCYVLAYVNRVSVGFAKLQMQQDLGMSDAVYGAGAGIFFIGYFLFEVPANIMLKKIGARRWLGSIIIGFGIISALTMYVRDTFEFYVIRFVLGVVESGFFPGVILYLTFWFTNKYRVRMVAAFMAAVPISGMLAGPASGWIMSKMLDYGGLHGWQWLFLLQGIPSVIAGIATFLYLPDTPRQSKWLNGEEKELISARIEEEEAGKRKAGAGKHRLVDAFKSPAVWLLSVVYFGITAGNYGITFYLPQVIKDTLTSDPDLIGWIYAIPWTFTVFAMMWFGHHSDKTGERRWHFALAVMLSAAAFAVSAIPGIPGVAGFMALTVAAAAIMCGFTVFWSMPSALLSGTAAAAGIAWINSVGNLAGYASPYFVGAVRDRTQSMTIALVALSIAALLAAVVALYVTRKVAAPKSVRGTSA